MLIKLTILFFIFFINYVYNIQYLTSYFMNLDSNQKLGLKLNFTEPIISPVKSILKIHPSDEDGVKLSLDDMFLCREDDKLVVCKDQSVSGSKLFSENYIFRIKPKNDGFRLKSVSRLINSNSILRNYYQKCLEYILDVDSKILPENINLTNLEFRNCDETKNQVFVLEDVTNENLRTNEYLKTNLNLHPVDALASNEYVKNLNNALRTIQDYNTFNLPKNNAFEQFADKIKTINHKNADDVLKNLPDKNNEIIANKIANSIIKNGNNNIYDLYKNELNKYTNKPSSENKSMISLPESEDEIRKKLFKDSISNQLNFDTKNNISNILKNADLADIYKSLPLGDSFIKNEILKDIQNGTNNWFTKLNDENSKDLINYLQSSGITTPEINKYFSNFMKYNNDNKSKEKDLERFLYNHGFPDNNGNIIGWKSGNPNEMALRHNVMHSGYVPPVGGHHLSDELRHTRPVNNQFRIPVSDRHLINEELRHPISTHVHPVSSGNVCCGLRPMYDNHINAFPVGRHILCPNDIHNQGRGHLLR